MARVSESPSLLEKGHQFVFEYVCIPHVLIV